jgi:hypothetical protein
MSTLLELQRADITTDYSISVLADYAAMAESLRGALSGQPEVADVTIPADWVPGQQVEKRRLLDLPAELLSTIDPVRPGNNGQALKEALAYLTDVEDAVPAERRDTYRVLRGGLTRVADEPETVDRLNRSLQRELEVSLEDLHEMLGAEPFTLDDLPADVHARMVTRDDRHLVIVEPAGVLANRAATEAFITAVANVAPNYAGRAVVEWGVGGVVVQSFLQAAGIAVAGIVVLLVIYFRSTRLALLVLVPLLLATLFTFALAELLGMTLNMANILVVPLIFGLGVDTGIHVVHRFDNGGIDAVFRTSTARAVTISGLTTIGTFFSLSFSPHQGAASVGLLLSLAIALMLAVTYVVLPAMLRLAGGRMRKLSPSV